MDLERYVQPITNDPTFFGVGIRLHAVDVIAEDEVPGHVADHAREQTRAAAVIHVDRKIPRLGLRPSQRLQEHVEAIVAINGEPRDGRALLGKLDAGAQASVSGKAVITESTERHVDVVLGDG